MAQRRAFPLPVRLGLGVGAVAFGAALLAGCSDVSPKGVSGQAPTAAPSQTDQSPQGQRGADLIAHPGSPFVVTFGWENPVSGDQGLLLWRQGNGVRRWDLIGTKDGEMTGGGSITFETDFDAIGALGAHSVGCLWVTGDSASVTQNAPPGQAFVSCSWGGSVVFNPIEDVLLSRVGAALEDTTIVGKRASCYSLDDRRLAAGTLCVDASEGVPLLITAEYNPEYGGSRFSQRMEAISVSTAQQHVPVPLGLEQEAAGGFPDYEGMAALSDLGLPDLPELEQ
jgi:hypothetical protein